MRFNTFIKTLAITSSVFALMACDNSSSSTDDEEESSSSYEEESSSSISKDVSSSSKAKDASSSSESNYTIVAYGVASDYKSGELTFALEKKSLAPADIELGSDVKLVSNGKNVYALTPSTIALIDASKLPSGGDAVINQVSIGDYGYPYNIAFNQDGKTGWVVLNGRNSVLKIDISTLEILDSTSVADFAASSDVSASAVDAKIVDGKLAILLGRLENYTATKPGLIALFDAETGDYLDTIPLNTLNPMAMATNKDKLIVATQGTYNASYGTDADELRGLESVDVSKKKATVLAYGTDFGGGLYKLAVDTIANVAYAAIYKGYGDVPLKAFDISKKEVSTVKAIYDAEGALYWDAIKDVLYIGDRSYGSEDLYIYSNKVLTALSQDDVALPSYALTVANW